MRVGPPEPSQPVTAERRRPVGERAVRVACVRDHLHPSGGTDELHRVFRRLDQQRIDLELLVLGRRTTKSDAFESAGIKLRHLAQKHHLFATLRAIGADQLFLSGSKSEVWGSLAARWLGLPASHFFNHMMPASRIGVSIYIAQRAAIRRNDHAVAVSETGKQWVSKQYGLPVSQIDVIHPTIVIEQFADAVRAKCDGSPVIAVIGRVLFCEKGQHLMVEVMPTLLSRYPNAVLNVIGDGPDLPALRDLVGRSGLAQSIRLLGQRHDVAAQIKAAAMVVVPSTCREGFPLVTLEAAAAGRPSVAFASGGLVESVQDGETGILVPPGDVRALTSAILSLLDNPERASAMGQAGRRFAQDFRIERQVEAVTTHFEKLNKTIAA